MDLIEARLDNIDGRLERVEARLDRIDGRLERVEARLGTHLTKDEFRAGAGDVPHERRVCTGAD